MKLFVWDMHGTLEKGTEIACLHISNDILKRNNYSERFTQEEIDLVFGRKWRDIFQTKIPNMEEKIYESLEEQAFEKATENFEEQVQKYIRKNDHSEEVLSTIKAAGHEQILISNVTEDNLEKFIGALELTRFFSPKNRYAVTTNNGENPKVSALKEYLDNSLWAFTDIITIGDREGDIELAHVAGGVSYLYAHPGRLFQNCKGDIIPDYRINDLREILKEL